METRNIKPHIIVIVLLILLSIGLAKTVDVRLSNEAGIIVELPEKVGNWQGSALRYCLERGCRNSFIVSNDVDPEKCPECGHEAGSMALAELDMLPKDTEILKKLYKHTSGASVYVSIVLSGKDRTSIHRPQLCLVGQGNEIVKSTVISVPINDREPLEVMVLDMANEGQTPQGQKFNITRYYAYWFVGKDRETPYHIQRLIWMASDRIFRNVSHRWAYISVAGGRDNTDKHHSEIKNFLNDLYPLMLVDKT